MQKVNDDRIFNFFFFQPCRAPKNMTKTIFLFYPITILLQRKFWNIIRKIKVTKKNNYTQSVMCGFFQIMPKLVFQHYFNHNTQNKLPKSFYRPKFSYLRPFLNVDFLQKFKYPVKFFLFFLQNRMRLVNLNIMEKNYLTKKMWMVCYNSTLYMYLR